MINQGDTLCLVLDYTVDGEELVDYAPDEIEFCMGSNRYTLTDGDITIGETSGMYEIHIDQSESFELGTISQYQIRIKKDGEVASSSIERILIGASISRTVI